jgi:chromosome partitioning protein
MKTVAVLGTKGGSTKTATSHLLCLGAYFSGEPAVYTLTDPQRRLRGEGRPYAVLDGRLPAQLAVILNTARHNLSGWLFIDGGGNRPAFDKEIYETVELTVIPFRASEEDIDTVAENLRALPKAFAWPTAWPTNPLAVSTAEYLIEGLGKAFPQRIMTPAVPFVNSISDLLAGKLVTPSSPVRQIARKAFETITDYYEAHVPASEHSTSAQFTA